MVLTKTWETLIKVFKAICEGKLSLKMFAEFFLHFGNEKPGSRSELN